MTRDMQPGFTVFPAIDLRGGEVVRLERGKDDARTRYALDPVAVAEGYVAAGAEALHVVDLDAAFGDGAQKDVVRRIVAAARVPVQVGGGMRDDATVDTMLEAGAAKVIVGSAAVERPDWVAALAARHGARVVVGIDAEDGEVKTRGWVKGSGVRATDLAKRMAQTGLQRTIVTNIAKDGTGQGPDIDLCAEIARVSGLEVVVSGGVGALSHVEAAARRRGEGLVGIIVGKALFDGRFGLEAALEAARC